MTNNPQLCGELSPLVMCWALAFIMAVISPPPPEHPVCRFLTSEPISCFSYFFTIFIIDPIKANGILECFGRNETC